MRFLGREAVAVGLLCRRSKVCVPETTAAESKWKIESRLWVIVRQ